MGRGFPGEEDRQNDTSCLVTFCFSFLSLPLPILSPFLSHHPRLPPRLIVTIALIFKAKYSIMDPKTEKDLGDTSSTEDQSDSEETPGCTAPTLKGLAVNRIFNYLDKCITSSKAAASFVCGGTISSVSSVRLYWDTADDAEPHKLVLPLEPESAGTSGLDNLRRLVADCAPASFGRGQQDVMDPEYRRAGKLDRSRFTTDFCPDECGIVRLAEQYLLPNFSTTLENQLPFRRLKAQLYKLNVGGFHTRLRCRLTISCL
jgi:hypothetical protein